MLEHLQTLSHAQFMALGLPPQALLQCWGCARARVDYISMPLDDHSGGGLGLVSQVKATFLKLRLFCFAEYPDRSAKYADLRVPSDTPHN